MSCGVHVVKILGIRDWELSSSLATLQQIHRVARTWTQPKRRMTDSVMGFEPGTANSRDFAIVNDNEVSLILRLTGRGTGNMVSPPLKLFVPNDNHALVGCANWAQRISRS